jgi:nicotinamidase-related amidase
MTAIQLNDVHRPLLLVIDVQQEYTTKGRPYYLHGHETSLGNCRRILNHGRAHGWTIAHVRHEQPGPVFGPHQKATQFVKGFEPLPHEPLFTKNNFSCYSNPGFERFMEASRAERIYIVGYNSLMCCLATIIEGYHRGHDLTFVKDASLARATPDADERTAHLHVTNIVSFYANVTTTAEVLAPALVELPAFPAAAPALSYGTG